jgi:hypothetical protein
MRWTVEQVVVALMGGGLLVAVVALFGDRLKDRRLDAKERRAFQKQTLLDLKVALDALTSASVDKYAYLMGSSPGQPDLGFAPLPADLQARLTEAETRARLLSGQAADAPLREQVNSGIAQLISFAIQPSKVRAGVAMAEGTRLLRGAIDRCDEIIRGL